jgi:hypothetical protein
VNVFAVYALAIVVDEWMNEFTFVSPYAPPVDRHVPFTAKHPAVRLIPFANVDDAVVEDTFSMFADIPPVNVEVAVLVNLFVPENELLSPNRVVLALLPTEALRHTPSIATHPSDRSIPPANVDVAFVSVTASEPPNVEVAVEVEVI